MKATGERNQPITRERRKTDGWTDRQKRRARERPLLAHWDTEKERRKHWVRGSACRGRQGTWSSILNKVPPCESSSPKNDWLSEDLTLLAEWERGKGLKQLISSFWNLRSYMEQGECLKHSKKIFTSKLICLHKASLSVDTVLKNVAAKPTLKAGEIHILSCIP